MPTEKFFSPDKPYLPEKNTYQVDPIYHSSDMQIQLNEISGLY